MEINSTQMQRLQPLQSSVPVARTESLNRSGAGSGVREAEQPPFNPAVAQSATNNIDPALLDYTETLRAVRAARFADQSSPTQTTLQTPAANPQMEGRAAEPAAATAVVEPTDRPSVASPPILNPEPTQPPPQSQNPVVPTPTVATVTQPVTTSQAVVPPPAVDVTGSAPVAGRVDPNSADGRAPTVTPESAANPAAASDSSRRANAAGSAAGGSTLVDSARAAAVEIYRLNQTIFTPTANGQTLPRIDAMI